jgi:hypothetical protein
VKEWAGIKLSLRQKEKALEKNKMEKEKQQVDHGALFSGAGVA